MSLSSHDIVCTFLAGASGNKSSTFGELTDLFFQELHRYGYEIVQKENKLSIDARCEPPPEHLDKRWHWLSIGGRADFSNGVVEPHQWMAGKWDRGLCYLGDNSPDEAYNLGWRYVAPCEEPKT